MGNLLPPPVDLDSRLHPKFADWRPGQDEAVLAGLHSDKRFVVHAAPTGTGKTLLGVASHLLAGCRTVILTSTKGLQDQVAADFGSVGLQDIRGAGNYRCLDAAAASTTCDDGHCHFGLPCQLQRHGCLYYDQRARALGSNLVVTNYPYWFTSNEYGEGLGDVELLILDEAHAAVGELQDFIRVELTERELEHIGLEWPKYQTPEDWVTFWRRGKQLAKAIEDKGGRRHTVKEARNLQRKFDSLLVYEAERQWVMEDRRPWGVSWEPLWPGEFSEKVLFRGVPKVLLTSATVRPKTLSLLGLQDGSYDYIDHESAFAPGRRPVYMVQADPPIRVDNRMTEDTRRRWLGLMDDFIESRLAWKGIIPTVSYERAQLIASRSKFRHHMLTHDRGPDLLTVVERFKQAKPPCILVSPSVSTGFDFPGEEARWVLVAKLPFPDSRGSLMRARQKADPDYGGFLMAQELTQAAGRGMRSASDWCEVAIVDGHGSWALWKNKRHFPRYFLDAVTVVGADNMPAPLGNRL